MRWDQWEWIGIRLLRLSRIWLAWCFQALSLAPATTGILLDARKPPFKLVLFGAFGKELNSGCGDVSCFSGMSCCACCVRYHWTLRLAHFGLSLPPFRRNSLIINSGGPRRI